MFGSNYFGQPYFGQGFPAIPQPVDAATVLVAIQVTSVEAVDLIDSATVLVDLQAISTAEDHTTFDATTVYLTITPSATEDYIQHIFDDSATVLVGLQASIAQEGLTHTDSQTILVDLQTSGVESRQSTDSATIYVDIRNLGGECFSRLHFSATGEDYLRWYPSDDNLRWSPSDNLRWIAAIVLPGPSLEC